MMTTNRLKNKILIGLLLTSVTLGSCACGQAEDAGEIEQITLLEPAGVALNYELATVRTLYDSKSYGAYVVPYTEEYELPNGQSFVGFDSLPGQSVKTGTMLLHSSTENIDKQLENMQDGITQLDESYQEFLKENQESLAEAEKNKADYEGYFKHALEIEPDEQITDADGNLVDNPEHAVWASQEKGVEATYRNYCLTVDKLTAKIDQRTQLYNLDRAYQLKQIQYLKDDLKYCTLSSMMDGVVSAVRYLNSGDWMNAETPMMAVSDLNRKIIRCDYINKSTILKAQDVYAVIDGKRYEVEYQAIDTDEYNRQMEKNDKVYSSFYLIEDSEEVEIGDFATIVVINDSVKDVITVPKDSVKKDDETSYVYIVNNGTGVYTPVEVGMSDGAYTEIVSGVSENDKVLSEKAVKSGSKFTTVSKGTVSSTFNSDGYLYYPASELVSNPVKYGTCYLVQNHVALYQQVKKGDVLATIRVVPDQIELDKLTQQMTRVQERLAEYKANKDIAEKDKVKTIESMEKTISDYQKKIKEMKADYAVKEIKAPVNGIITAKADMEPESLLQSGAGMYLISDEQNSYLFVGDENGQLVYGQAVKISYKDSQNTTQYVEGTVVTVNQMSISKSLSGNNRMRYGWNSQTSGALIMVSSEDIGRMAGTEMDGEGFWDRTSYSVTADTRKMEDVLIIPRKAVTEMNGSLYVRVKNEDGTVTYRSFVAGGADTTNYWVAEGLTEGTEICLE